MSLELVPVTLAQARAFVGAHHRHNGPPLTWKFGVGLEDETGELAGVAMAGLPKARMLMEKLGRRTLEVNRTCTLGHRNANSMLYGAIARAAKALGWRRLYTYTILSEPGTSLLACGWTREGVVEAGVSRTWESARHPGGVPQVDLFGNVRNPEGPKVRWRLDLAPHRQETGAAVITAATG